MKREYYAIDVVKFIMAICVIAIHTHPFKGETQEMLYNGYSVILQLAVPFFFMSSGYLLFEKMKTVEERRLQILKEYLAKMIRYYILWSLIYFPLAVYGYIQDEMKLSSAVFVYIRDLLFVGEHHYSWHLWYLLSLIFGIIAIILLRKLRWKEWLVAENSFYFQGYNWFGKSFDRIFLYNSRYVYRKVQ